MQSSTEIVDPSDGTVIATVPDADAAAVDEAVARAAVAQRGWAATAPRERGRRLLAIAQALDARRERLAELESANVGKPIREARGDVETAIAVFEYYAGAVDKLLGATIPVAGGISMTFREPLGVVGVIVPWNFPLAIASWKVAPALATGNAVVLKPAQLTPLTALELAEAVEEAGLPADVLAVLPGAGSVAGERLLGNPQVAKVSFTGSTAVGRRVLEASARTIQRCTLELGGKSANVVFADADVDAAAAQAPAAVFGNAGQDCCARSRILVQRPVFDRFLDAFTAAARAWRVGDPRDEATDMGPLISAARVAEVAGYAEADVAFQGTAPDGPGCWFPPTILAPVGNDARAAREEIFGPVACVIPFDDEADAIELANDTPYGLSGSIWTCDGARALRVSRALECGALSINSNTALQVPAPFGGFKQSGLGRELGFQGMEGNTELKSVFYATTPTP